MPTPEISECPTENLSEKFNYARDLLVNKSKKDPPNDPYKSKYEAKAILLSIEALLLDQTTFVENKSHIENKLAVVYCLLGSIYYDVEEPSQGNEYAAKAVEILAGDPVNPECVICYVSSLNILGFAACKYEKQDEAIEYLDNAVSAYKSYKNKFRIAPKEFCAIFGSPIEDEVDGLEKAYTSTLFYLAQVYSAKGDRLKSAKYCHSTLRRQLDIKGFDAIDWALNSATLSQYLIENNAFREARNHLGAAQMVLEKESEVVKLKNEDSEEVKALKESLQHRTADIFRCWGKYGIYLMNASKERLLMSEGDTLDAVPKPPDEIKDLLFSGFEDDKIKEYECVITSDFLLTYDDAKPVFRTSQEWLNKAKEYYTLEDHASDHVSIIQDSSQLYHLLAFYQPDESLQCKFHKRRLDMLVNAVDALNPSFYLNICRELWYELGETCLFMADLKRSQGESTTDHHFFDKAQQLYFQGIKYFETYIDSFKIKKNGTIEKYPDGYEKSILMACMFLGRMYSKLTSQEKSQLLRTQKSSLHWYRTVLEYCNVHKEVAEIIPEELAICREMANLIPAKLSKIERFL